MCYHPTPHQESLVGSARTRASEPYPAELAKLITDAWVECFDDDVKIERDVRKLAGMVERHLFDLKKRKDDVDTLGDLATVGSRMLGMVRKRHPCAPSSEMHEHGKDVPLEGEESAPSSYNDETTFDKITGGRAAFERQALQRLQRADPELKDIIMCLELRKECPNLSEDEFYRALRKRLGDSTAQPSKR